MFVLVMNMSSKRQNHLESLVLCDLSVLRNRTSGLVRAVRLIVQPAHPEL